MAGLRRGTRTRYRRCARVPCVPGGKRPLTVVDKRWHSGTLLLQLASPSGEVYDLRETVDASRVSVTDSAVIGMSTGSAR